MKKYKFFETDGNRRIVNPSRGYFTSTKGLPEEFTLDQLIMAAPGLLSKSKEKRIRSAKKDTLIDITRLAGWSSQTGTPIYLSIKCLGDAPLAIDDVRKQKEKLENRLKEIDAEIYKLAQSLVVEKSNLQKQLKEIKEDIKRFDRGEK